MCGTATVPAALAGVTDPLERCWVAVDAYCRVVDSRRDATLLAYRSTKSLPPSRRELIKNAEDRNLDAAALSYVDLTLTCVKCHKHVREVRKVELDEGPGRPAGLP